MPDRHLHAAAHRPAFRLNLEVDLLFFDTTSTYFELEDPDTPVDRDEHSHPLPTDGDGDGGRDGGAGENMRVKEVKISQTERFVICHNPDGAQRDAHIREQLVAQLDELIAGSDRLPVMKRGELRGRISTMPGPQLADQARVEARTPAHPAASPAREEMVGSPLAVAIPETPALLDRIPRKIVDDAAHLATAPALLRAFIRFCHHERGVRTALTEQPLAAACAAASRRCCLTSP